MDENRVFKGYMTHDPEKAYNRYIEKENKEPTLIVIRPGFPTKSEHPLLLESQFGAAGVMLVTHRISIDKMKELANSRKSLADIADEIFDPEDDECISISDDNIAKVHKKYKPRIPKPMCPHCQQEIDKDKFNELGYWYGWKKGIEPPYWQSLRLYVFKRDEYCCLKCQETLPPAELVCHHIIPKESGGKDGARNLMTLCKNCHPDDKPIFSDDD